MKLDKKNLAITLHNFQLNCLISRGFITYVGAINPAGEKNQENLQNILINKRRFNLITLKVCLPFLNYLTYKIMIYLVITKYRIFRNLKHC